jgi:hypothetical protein
MLPGQYITLAALPPTGNLQCAIINQQGNMTNFRQNPAILKIREKYCGE